MVNRVQTFQRLRRFVFPFEHWDEGKFASEHSLHDQFFTGAHVTKGLRMTVEAMHEVERRRLWLEISLCSSVERIVLILRSVPNLGPFFSHQIAQDLRFMPFFRSLKDGDSWALAGPGARGGLKEIGFHHCVTDDDYLEAMRKIWKERRTEWHHDYPLEVKDIQQSLCEYHKYVKHKNLLEKGIPCKTRLFKPRTS